MATKFNFNRALKKSADTPTTTRTAGTSKFNFARAVPPPPPPVKPIEEQPYSVNKFVPDTIIRAATPEESARFKEQENQPKRSFFQRAKDFILPKGNDLSLAEQLALQKGGEGAERVKKIQQERMAREIRVAQDQQPKTISEVIERNEADKQIYWRQQRQEQRVKEKVKTMPTLPKDYKEPGVVGSAVEEAKLASAAALSAVGGTLEKLGLRANDPISREWGEKLADSWKATIIKHPEWYAPAEWNDEKANKWKDPRLYSRMIGGLIPSVGGTLVAATAGGILGGPPGAVASGGAFIYTLEGGSTYNEMLEKGASLDKAANASDAYAAVATLLEGISFIRVGSKFVKGPALDAVKQSYLRKLAKELPKSVAIEASTEGAQQFAQNVATKWINSNQDLMENVLESTVAGGLGGVAFGVVGTAAEGLKSNISPLTPASNVNATATVTEPVEEQPISAFGTEKRTDLQVTPTKNGKFTITGPSVPDNLQGLTFNTKAQANEAILDIPILENFSEARGAAPIAEFEQRDLSQRPIPQQSKEFKLFEKSQEFVQKYAGLMGEGQQSPRTQGWFDPNTHNLFVEGRNDLSVVAHEVTHFVDNKIGTAQAIIQGGKETSPIRKRLTELYVEYYPGGRVTQKLETRIKEGIATLLQKYAETPTTIREQYPDLVEAFFTPGGKHYNPLYKEMIDDLETIITDYQALEANDQIGALIQRKQSEVSKKTWKSRRVRIKSFIADNILPAEFLAIKTGSHMTTKDFSLWMRLYRNWQGVVAANVIGNRGYYQWDVTSGNYVRKLDFNWNDLVDLIYRKGHELTFSNWLIARRKYYEYERLDEVNAEIAELTESFSETTDPELIKEIQGDLKPLQEEAKRLREVIKNDGISRSQATKAFEKDAELFAEEAEMFDTLIRQDLDFAYATRKIDTKTYNTLKTRKGYASYAREVFNEILGSEDGTTHSAVNIGGKRVSAFITRTGGQKAILDPVYSGINNHMEITKKGLQQTIYNTILDEVKPAAPQLIQEVPLETSIMGDGRVYFPQEKDPNMIVARDKNGKRHALLVDGELMTVIHEVIDHRSVGSFARLFLIMARLFTKGTTSAYPQFGLSNLVMDTITTTANTRNKIIPIYDNIKELAKTINKDSDEFKFLMEYLTAGAERQTLAGWQDLSAEDFMDKVNGEAKGIAQITKLVVEKGVDLLSVPSKYSEIFNRATEYIKARKSGKSSLVALEEAGRVSAPFHHLGSWGSGKGADIMHFLIRSVPFLNPGIQVLAQMEERITTKDGALRYLIVVSAVTAAMVASFDRILKKATKEQKQQYRDLEPELLARYIYLPDSSGKGLNRIRVPENLTIFGAVINMALSDRFMNEGIDYTAGDFVDAGLAWVPDQFDVTNLGRAAISWMPQVFKPGVMVAFGIKDFPRVSPIEPMSTQTLPVEFRELENTSKMAKWLSKHFGLAKWANLSPAKIDFLITGYFGRASGFVTGKPGAYDIWATTKQDYFFKSGRTINDYYKIKTEASQENSAYNRKFKDLTGAQKNALDKTRGEVKRVDKLISEYNELDLEKDLQRAEELRNRIFEGIEKTINAYEEGKKIK